MDHDGVKHHLLQQRINEWFHECRELIDETSDLLYHDEE